MPVETLAVSLRVSFFCTGNTPGLKHWNIAVLAIKAVGRGSYQRTKLNSFGFPRGYLMRQKKAKGFQSGDIVLTVVPKGKRSGIHFGKLRIRSSGSFDIQTKVGRMQHISHRHCRMIQRADGYGYQTKQTAIHPSAKADGPLA